MRNLNAQVVAHKGLIEEPRELTSRPRRKGIRMERLFDVDEVNGRDIGSVRPVGLCGGVGMAKQLSANMIETP
jgi:hypothetical protein